MSASKLAAVRPLLQSAIDRGRTPGVLVAIARHGKVVLLESVGKMDLESGRAMRSDGIFRIHSMSKPITTVAALTLVEEGKLDLDAPVSCYLPEFKALRVWSGTPGETVDANREMTIRDLMRHTSGLTYGKTDGTWVEQLNFQSSASGWGTTAGMVSKLSKLPLQCQPGTQFNYGVSTDVLGRVIEVVSGKPLDELLRQRIFIPLDMHDTGFFVPQDKSDRLTTSYSSNGRALNPTDPPSSGHYRKLPALLSGGGGLVSTVRDYLRFCQMLLNGGEFDGVRMLSSQTVHTMTTNQLPPEALPMKLAGYTLPGCGFGLGFMVRMQGKTPGITDGEYSWFGAASTYFCVSPKSDLIVLIFQQVEPINIELQMSLKPLIDASIVNSHAGF